MKIEYFKDTFTYFSTMKSSLRNGTILDYGCNYGSFLESSNKKFKNENYTGIDVDIDALKVGKKLFPGAKFIHYDGFNPMYNPDGKSDKPILNKKYDNIISYSVLTHTTEEDMIESLKWLYEYLNPGGSILASILTLDNKIATKFFYNKRVFMYGSCDDIVGNNVVYLEKNKIVETPCGGEMLLSFYDREYLKKILLTHFQNVNIFNSRGGSGCFQNCIVINKIS